MKKNIALSSSPLSIETCIRLAESEQAGAIDVFIGTVRDQTEGRKVTHLEFEAYEPMAIAEMDKIAEAMAARWPIISVVIHHRTGFLKIGDVAVVIAVATPHRKAAFEACQYAIDTLKQTVPIWKKEVFEGGAVWIAAHP
ncbi:MAG TPA: molybdenum cofactor biosynthesis protein MoaE [Saprospiraceae bacterium]|nr:molybdenum cofactor biosynthesis protein MoaE [Saprospiraceae bacterium]HMQ81976.1 molybdenum cofactor biosynthesis protein MoaE [Saprospiraceae bacterium]